MKVGTIISKIKFRAGPYNHNAQIANVTLDLAFSLEILYAATQHNAAVAATRERAIWA